MSAKPDGTADERPSITIPGVPPYVTTEQVCDAIRLLGIDPTEVAEMSFTPDAVFVEVYSNGRPASTPAWRWTHDGRNIATHRLTIPIINGENE